MSAIARDSPDAVRGIGWSETRRRIRVDRDRLDAWCSGHRDHARAGFCSPPRLCVWLYRWSHYCYARGWRLAARML